MQKSRKQLLTSAVIAFGVADCVGIYVVQQRLAEPVPDSVRSDPSVVAVIDTGVFRPEQGMPAAGAPAAPALAVAAPKAAAPAARVAAAAPAQLAAAAPEQVTLARADAPQRYAPLVPVSIKSSHRGAAQGVFGAVDLSVSPARRATPAKPSIDRLAAVRPAVLRSAAGQSAAMHPAAGVRANPAHRVHERVDSEFAAAFGNDFADVPLDVQVTRLQKVM
jgi:hypothetical protein